MMPTRAQSLAVLRRIDNEEHAVGDLVPTREFLAREGFVEPCPFLYETRRLWILTESGHQFLRRLEGRQ